MKKELPKLSFFSETIPEKLTCQINNVQALIQSERITFQRGYEMLHQAQKDNETIYYATSTRIAKAQNEITNLRKRGRFDNGQLKTESILSLASERAVTSMRTAIREYRAGLLTRRQLRRARSLMMGCIDQDNSSLYHEVGDIIRKIKPEPKKEVDHDWRDVPLKDMEVKKVSACNDLT